MTLRAIFIGLVGVVLINSLTYFNDNILRQTYMVGNHMPLIIYGSLLVFLVLFNPLLARLGRGLMLNGRELVVILAMVLCASTFPGSGMMRTMTGIQMLPHHYNKSEVGWQRHNILEYTPEQMLADPGENDVHLNAYIQGLKRGQDWVGFGDIPWEAWTHTLWFWVPMLLFFYIGFLGLCLVFHRQWSEHEQLPYPLAKFADALIPKEGESKGSVFRSPLFWIAAGIVVTIHFNNYAFVWFPSLVKIPTDFDFRPLFSNAPALQAENIGAYHFRLYFSFLAIAYFLAAEVSLAIGTAPMLYPFIKAFFTSQGVSLSGGGHQAPERFVVSGAFVGIFMGLLYTGRHYYWNTVRMAVGLTGSKEVTMDSVWGARIYFISAALFVGGLVYIGLDWQLAVLLAIVFMVFFVVMARVIAETGLFFFQPWWLPSAMLVGLLGARALGPEAIVILFLVSVLFMVDPREAFTPYVMNALKMMEIRKIQISRGAGAAALAIIVGLGVALPMTLFYQYNHGARMDDTWGTMHVPKLSFDETVKFKQRLDAQGLLEDSENVSGWSRITAVSADRTSLISFVVGLGLVLAFTIGRLRFAKWPVHPVFFLVFCSYAGTMVAFSFLLGWFIKVVVTKYGGEPAYHGLKPMMFGLLAGDLLGGGVPIAIGWIYYFITGELPETFGILPG